MKHAIRALAFGLLLAAWSAAAQAASEWFTGDVVQAGVTSGGTVLIRITTPAFQNKWCRAPDRASREMLAIALTAVTAGQPIRVRLDPDAAGFPLIRNMYLLPE